MNGTSTVSTHPRDPAPGRDTSRLDDPGGHDASARVWRSAATELRRHAAVLVSLAVITIIGVLGSSEFATSQNLTNLAGRIGPLGIIAVGMTVLMIAGEIDLSIGSMVSVLSILIAKQVNVGASTVVILALAIGAGAGVGLLTGLVVTATRAPAFMITLGGLSIWAGVASAWTDNQPVIITSGFETLGITRVAGIPVSVLVFAGVALACYGLLHHLRFGRAVFAVGGNEEAARVAGVGIDRVRLAVYVLNGALVGVGAAILTSRVGSGDPSAGVGLELQIIAAVVIGGATLAGGHGSLVGAALGVTLLAAIANVLNLLGAESYVTTIIFGAFIAIAVGLRGPRTTRTIAAVAARLRRSREARSGAMP